MTDGEHQAGRPPDQVAGAQPAPSGPEAGRLPDQVAGAQPAPRAPEAASTDLIQSVTRLDRAIKERRDTDVQLVSWWLYILLLGPLTAGIFWFYLCFKRMSRVDDFSRRKHTYYDSLVEWTQREAAAKGTEDMVHHDLVDLGDEVNRAYNGNLRPINAPLSLILMLVTVTLYYFFVLYRLNRYWWDAQIFEQDFDDKLSQIWTKLGIVRYPVTFNVDQSKRRSYPLYLVLSFVTIGIWWVVWDYKIHTDPDNLFNEFHSNEDTVLQTIRSH